MKPHESHCRSAVVTALLCGAMSVPVTGWTHWEGFEAADPSTPAALLRFESAASGYVEAAAAPVSWFTPFENDMRLTGGSHNHGNMEDAATRKPRPIRMRLNRSQALRRVMHNPRRRRAPTEVNETCDARR